MKLKSDRINEGLEFNIDMDGKSYSGTITIEAIQDKFDIDTTDIEHVNHFFNTHPQLLEQEICNALHRHPPIGKEHILILPHHMH